MRFHRPLLPGTLVRRYQRFLCDVRLRNGRVVTAHCPNSGSLLGCQAPGSPVRLSRRDGGTGRLRYTWEMIRVGRAWIGVNTQRPNRLVQEAIERGWVAELSGYRVARREVPVGPGTRLVRPDRGPRPGHGVLRFHR